VPDHDPPQGYICYRCGEKGHWIQLCPTNDNPEFDNRPRVKRTTGIPKSFLKTVDKATALAQHGGDGDDSKTPSGIMVNADGEFVIAEPDKASWEQFQAKAKTTAQKPASQVDKEVQELGLECPVDKRMFIDPMKTPCCEKTYCNDCITNALIESDFVCPGCQQEGVLIDDLKPDEEAADKIKKYLADKDSKAKEASKSPAASPKSPVAADATPADVKDEQTKTNSKSPPPNDSEVKSPKFETALVGTKSPTPAAATNGTTPVNGESNPKKRPAEDAAENTRIPKAPKAMQKQQQQQNMMDIMTGMPMGPNMPGMNMPMMPFPGMPGMPGMPMMPGMGMPMGMNNMNMGMMNPMMNPMMAGGGMPNFNMNGPGGFGGMPGFNGMPGPGMPMSMGGMNGGMGGPGGPNGMNQHHGNGGGYNNGNHFQQQQQYPPHRNFSHQPADDEDAYFRKPVNPQRHQNRVRRARPSDYREL
jgi:protein MPE1